MSRHKTCYVISYHGILCHDMSYVTTIAASLIHTQVKYIIMDCFDQESKKFRHSISLSKNYW